LMGKEIDGRADQYALAATAFHLLTGTPVFQHSNPAVVISQHLSSAPPPIGSRRPELSDLGPVFSKALAKAPEDRFDQCLDFAHALEHRIGTATNRLGPTDQTVSSFAAARPRHQKQSSRTRLAALRPAVLVPVLIAALLVAGSAIAVLLLRQDRPTTAKVAPSASAPSPASPNMAAQQSAQAAPVLPVVAVGAQCGTLGAAGVTPAGAPAYCAHLSSTGSTIWSLYPGEVSNPTVTPDPSDPVYPSDTEMPLRVCVQQTGQTRLQCLQDMRRSSQTPSS